MSQVACIHEDFSKRSPNPGPDTGLDWAIAGGRTEDCYMVILEDPLDSKKMEAVTDGNYLIQVLGLEKLQEFLNTLKGCQTSGLHENAGFWNALPDQVFPSYLSFCEAGVHSMAAGRHDLTG